MCKLADAMKRRSERCRSTRPPSSIPARGRRIGRNRSVLHHRPGCEIGARTRLMAHVYVEGPIEIGEDNVFYPYSTVGVAPQDLKYQGERRNAHRRPQKIREFVTIHRGTEGGGMITSIGDDNLLMAYVHIAHDVQVGSHTVLAHGATCGGPRHRRRLGRRRSFQRRPPVLPRRPARDHRRL